MMYRILRLIIVMALLAPGANAAEPKETIMVYKSATCGGDIQNAVLVDIKAKLGLTDRRLMSCHTAIVDGYVVEGHVPVDDIQRLIDEKPDIIGITAPGMPQFSPGMHSIDPKDYDVLSFDKNGKIELFSRY